MAESALLRLMKKRKSQLVVPAGLLLILVASKLTSYSTNTERDGSLTWQSGKSVATVTNKYSIRLHVTSFGLSNMAIGDRMSSYDIRTLVTCHIR